MNEDLKSIYIKRVVVKPETGCWEWKGARNVKGYGRVKINGKNLRAHRVYYAKLVGPIPEGLLVLHKCDNPPCVNPDHLEVGTQLENVRQSWERGRRTKKVNNES